MLRIGVNNNLVYHNPVGEIIHRPRKILRRDAIHRRAHAQVRSEEMNLFIGKTLLQAIDEIHLGTDRPLRTARGVLDRLDDERSRAVKIALLDHLAYALRMHQHLHAWNIFADLIDVPRLEPSVHRTMPSPQDQFRGAQFVFGVSTEIFMRVPQRHFIEWYSELRTGVSSEMLIGKKEHLVEFF